MAEYRESVFGSSAAALATGHVLDARPRQSGGWRQGVDDASTASGRRSLPRPRRANAVAPAQGEAGRAQHLELAARLGRSRAREWTAISRRPRAKGSLRKGGEGQYNISGYQSCAAGSDARSDVAAEAGEDHVHRPQDGILASEDGGNASRRPQVATPHATVHLSAAGGSPLAQAELPRTEPSRSSYKAMSPLREVKPRRPPYVHIRNGRRAHEGSVGSAIAIPTTTTTPSWSRTTCPRPSADSATTSRRTAAASARSASA